MFKRKPKKTNEELRMESEKKIKEVEEKLKENIFRLENDRDDYVKQIVEAKKKNLPSIAEQTRTLLKRSMFAQKQNSAMLMQIKIAKQTRDLAEMSQQFMEGMCGIADCMKGFNQKVSVKKFKQGYVQSMFATQSWSRNLDEVLKFSNAVSSIEMEGDGITDEFDNDIDALIAKEESVSGLKPNKNGQKV